MCCNTPKADHEVEGRAWEGRAPQIGLRDDIVVDGPDGATVGVDSCAQIDRMNEGAGLDQEFSEAPGPTAGLEHGETPSRLHRHAETALEAIP